MDSKEYCLKAYNDYYEDFLRTHNTRDIPKGRKYAIGKTILSAISKYPNEDSVALWEFVKKAHYHAFIGEELNIEDEKIDKIISARQSWVKASGHAFEEIIKDECNKNLVDTNIQVLLQRDLTKLQKENKLANFDEDKVWLSEECKSDVFDLFVASKVDNLFKVWGVIQAKTSVRDRVTRDREPSQRAMQKRFWSVIFVFDAEFLHQPKFVAMVNGGTQEFADNGWHVAYSYEKGYNKDRIKYIGDNMALFVEDAKEAVKHFNGERRSFITNLYPKTI